METDSDNRKKKEEEKSCFKETKQNQPKPNQDSDTNIQERKGRCLR